MANKTGLKYYTVDTDRYLDIRIKRLKKDLGCRGVAVYDYILCEIYRDKGCFLEWNESTAFDVAEYYGLKESLVADIVNYCGAVGLFDKDLLARGIITSATIQKRYLDMCNRAKRSSATVPEKIRLIPEETEKLPEKNAVSPEKTENFANSSGSFPQSKVKERKKISPDGDTKKPPLPPPVSSRFLSLDELAEEAVKSRIWLDAIAKNLELAPEKVAVLIHDKFVPHCIREGKIHSNLSDFQSHFNRWSARQKYSSTNNGTTANTGQHTDPNAARQRQFAEHIIAKLNYPDSPEPDVNGLY